MVIFVFRLIDEESCVAKRLYCGLSAVSNNVGAHITASALPPSVQVFEQASGPLNDVSTLWIFNASFKSITCKKARIGRATEA